MISSTTVYYLGLYLFVCVFAEVRLNHLQSKGTVRSYHHPPSDHEYNPSLLYQWEYGYEDLTTQLDTQEVRHLHLDISYDEESQEFIVGHFLLDASTRCYSLALCLTEIHSWQLSSPGSPGLVVIIGETPVESDGVMLNITQAQWHEFDELLYTTWGDDLVTPAVLKANASSLGSALFGRNDTQGAGTGACSVCWPSFESFKDKVMVLLSSAYPNYVNRGQPAELAALPLYRTW